MCGRTSGTVPVTVTPSRTSEVEVRAWVAADDGERDLWDPCANAGQDRVAEVEHRVLIRVPIHGAREHEPMGDLTTSAGREVGGVDAGRDRPDSRAVCYIGECSSVRFGDGDRQVGGTAYGRFATAQLSPLDFEQGSARHPRLECREPLPDPVLHVVLEQHDRDWIGLWEVRGGDQKVGHANVELPLGEKALDLFAHRRETPLPEIDRIARQP